MSYDELVKSLRDISWKYGIYGTEKATVLQDAADAMEQLLKVAKKMHLWIFLHSGDEQEAYDWCGLSDEMNTALGYGGQLNSGQSRQRPYIIHKSMELRLWWSRRRRNQNEQRHIFGSYRDMGCRHL